MTHKELVAYVNKRLKEFRQEFSQKYDADARILLQPTYGDTGWVGYYVDAYRGGSQLDFDEMFKIERDFEAAYPGQLQELRAMALIACWLQARRDNAESEHYSFFAIVEKMRIMNEFYDNYPMGDEYKLDLEGDV